MSMTKAEKVKREAKAAKKAYHNGCMAVRAKAIKAGFEIPKEHPWKALRAWAEANNVKWPSAKR